MAYTALEKMRRINEDKYKCDVGPMQPSMYHSEQAMKAQREVTEVTNQLLEKNAQALHTGSVAIAREAERGVVDLETLKKTNQELITALDEVRQIQDQGRLSRAKAEDELARIEDELKKKLLEIISKLKKTASTDFARSQV